MRTGYMAMRAVGIADVALWGRMGIYRAIIIFFQKCLPIPNKSSIFVPREPAKPLYNA